MTWHGCRCSALFPRRDGMCFEFALLLTLLAQIGAFPNLFVEYHANSCWDHPVQGYANHQSPQPGCGTIDLQLHTPQAGQYCSGATYTLQLKFANPRRFLLTTTNGTFDTAVSSDDNCHGKRIVLGQEQKPVAAYSVTVLIPCATTGSIGFKVTSAGGVKDAYHQCELFYSITPSCQLETCTSNNDTLDMSVFTFPGINARVPIGASTACQPECSATTAPTSKPGCTASSNGYTCSTVLEELTLHWSTSACVPINACTAVSTWQAGCKSSNSGKQLHILAEATVKGYIGVAFATRPNAMELSDAVIGFIDPSGLGSIAAYPISQHSIAASSRYAATSGMLSYAGVRRTSQGVLMICFARPLAVAAALYSKNVYINRSIHFNWAISSNPRLGRHDKARSTKVNFGTGEQQTISSSRGSARHMHGVLMLLHWSLLMPMAALFARHKALFGRLCVDDIPVWIVVHWWMQALGITASLTAFLVLLVNIPDRVNPWQGTATYAAHVILGLTILSGTVVQLIIAVGPRPHVSSPWRLVWSVIHISTGRSLLLLAIVNMGMGIHLAHHLQGDAVWKWTLGLLGNFAILGSTELYLSRQRHRHSTRINHAMDFVGTGSPSPSAGSRLSHAGSVLQLPQRSASWHQWAQPRSHSARAVAEEPEGGAGVQAQAELGQQPAAGAAGDEPQLRQLCDPA